MVLNSRSSSVVLLLAYLGSGRPKSPRTRPATLMTTRPSCIRRRGLRTGHQSKRLIMGSANSQSADGTVISWIETTARLHSTGVPNKVIVGMRDKGAYAELALTRVIEKLHHCSVICLKTRDYSPTHAQRCYVIVPPRISKRFTTTSSDFRQCCMSARAVFRILFRAKRRRGKGYQRLKSMPKCLRAAVGRFLYPINRLW